jgi:DNA-binding NarL/FixJ family response regulator
MPLFTLLVFDPHPALLGILVRYIEAHHADSLTVAGAAFREPDALALAASAYPQVVLLGMRGAIPDGLGLIAAVRRLLPSAIIVGMSHLGTAGYAQAALDAGADTFVDKDDLKARLLPAILQIADARNTLSITSINQGRQDAPITHT